VDKELWLNGHKLVEPYVQHVFPRIEPYRDNFPSEPYGPVYDRARKMLTDNVVNGEVVVPEGFYFAMGDNRDNSLDSRYWGFVPRENIIGKPLVIFWSYDAPTEDWVDYNSNHFIDLAKNFFRKTRWERTLKLVRGYPVQ
jgi:signal peptidase I